MDMLDAAKADYRRCKRRSKAPALGRLKGTAPRVY